jgi:hypothetical protein
LAISQDASTPAAARAAEADAVFKKVRLDIPCMVEAPDSNLKIIAKSPR